MTEYQEERQRKRRPLSEFKNATKIYRCYCSKQYMSYSALYLHAELKHGLRIKNNDLKIKIRQIHFEETLNLKKIEIAQLDGNSFFRQIQNSGEFYRVPKKNKKLQIRESRQNEREKRIRNRLFRGKNCITTIFQEFIEEDERFNQNSQKQYAQLILYLLHQCLNANYKLFDNRNIIIYNDYCSETDPQMVANFFNFFSTYYIPQFILFNETDQEIRRLQQRKELNKFLVYLGRWLYENEYSTLQVYMNQQN